MIHMFKSISKYTYFSFIPLLLLALITVSLMVFEVISVYYLFATLIGWTLIAGLGIEVGYHRLFSHKHHLRIQMWKENVILFLGALGGQGSSISWAAVHRQHHKHTDKIKDPHTPQHRGAWHAFFGWTKEITENSNSISFRNIVDLVAKPNHQWIHRNQLYVLWITPLLIAVYDWKLALTLVCLPSAITMVVNNLINVVCHTKIFGNYRNYDTDDCSYNSPLFAFLSWGLAWHNNHHSQPASITFGNTISKRWWEIDLGNVFITLLKIDSK